MVQRRPVCEFQGCGGRLGEGAQEGKDLKGGSGKANSPLGWQWEGVSNQGPPDKFCPIFESLLNGPYFDLLYFMETLKIGFPLKHALFSL